MVDKVDAAGTTQNYLDSNIRLTVLSSGPCWGYQQVSRRGLEK